ncbi:MAG TPA: DUF1499 domain-containing protein [Methyloceanibacter sp.]|nr:DUF1499 domain-containing protein [Methyloceanibacter sp.]
MTAIYLQKTVHEGLWARRMALFFVQLLILTVLLHRFGTLATPAAMNLLAVSIGGLFLSILVAVIGLIRIWFGGQIGAAQAFTGIAIALLGLALPLYYLSNFFLLPRLNDIETTPRQPMQFKQLAAMRPTDANRIEQPDLAAAEVQEKAYPDIRPMELERSATETFDIVHEAVKRLGWNVVLNEPPVEDGPGRIEATTRTMIMGYTDDVLVRVTGDDARAFIDVRSVSRYGMHDLGANAHHIRTLFAEVQSALEKGEKTGLEQAEPTPKAGTSPRLKKPMQKRGARRNRRSTDQPQFQPAPRRGFPLLSPD